MSFVFLGVTSSSFAASESGASAAAVEAESVAAVEVAASETAVVPSMVVVREVVAPLEDDMGAESDTGAESDAGAESAAAVENSVESAMGLELAEGVESENVLAHRLENAIDDEDRREVRKLIELGVPLNMLYKTRYSGRITPLMMSVMTDCADIVGIILDAGADANMVDEDGDTALRAACSRRNIDMVQLLLAAGADVNIKDRDGCTSLMGIFWEEDGYPLMPLHKEKEAFIIARLLIFAGADIAEKDLSGDTVIQYVRFVKDKAGVYYGAGKILEAVALRRQTLRQQLSHSLREVYPLINVVLEYEAGIPVTAPTQAGEAEEDEKEQAQ